MTVTVSFARADEGTWDYVRSVPNEELKSRYISKWLNQRHCTSIMDIQVLEMMGVELDRRGLSSEEWAEIDNYIRKRNLEIDKAMEQEEREYRERE